MPLPDTNHNPGQPEADSPERREALRRLAKLGIAAGAAPAMITLLWSDRASAQSGPLASSVTATFPQGNYSSGGTFRVAFPEGILDLQTGENVTWSWSCDAHGVLTQCYLLLYNSSGRATGPIAGIATSSGAAGGPITSSLSAAYMPPDGEYPEGIEMLLASGGTDFELVLTLNV